MALSEYMKSRQKLDRECNHATCQGSKCRRPKKKTIVRETNKVSEKQNKALVEYNIIKDEMLEESNVCEMNTPVCTKVATGLQHKKRRGKHLLDKKYLIRSCDPCNTWAEEHPLEAIAMGIAVKVHTKEGNE